MIHPFDTTVDGPAECTMSCELMDDLGPPPDLILSMPPPPLPPSLQHLLADNASLGNDCNFCHLFADSGEDSEFKLPDPSANSPAGSWLTFAILATASFLIVGVLCILIIVKCRRGKFSPPDFCPLSASFLRSHKSPPPPCSPADSCISPVVNEKSPQSIITSAPLKKTSISTKYWRRGNDFGLEGHPSHRGYADAVGEHDENYAAAEGGSCTSSPVYAELDGALVTHIPQEQLLGHSGQVLVASASPYSVGLHTYSEVSEQGRMAALGSSAALLPDASYDNAAYLPTANADHYHTRSLRRGGHRAATLAQLGSATPLLTHHGIQGVQPGGSGYLTGGRPSKKPRPPLAQQLARGSIQRMQELDMQPAGSSRYRGSGTGLYDGLPIRQSPSLTTFKSSQPTYAYRDNPKRPLPPVPGVRL